MTSRTPKPERYIRISDVTARPGGKRWTAVTTLSALRAPERDRRRKAEQGRKLAERARKLAEGNLTRKGKGWAREHPLIPEVKPMLYTADGKKTPVREIWSRLRAERLGKPDTALVSMTISEDSLVLRYRYPDGVEDTMTYKAFANFISRLRKKLKQPKPT